MFLAGPPGVALVSAGTLRNIAHSALDGRLDGRLMLRAVCSDWTPGGALL